MVENRNERASGVTAGIERFTGWLENHGYASYDPYDIWGIPYSLWARRLYYKKGPAGLPFIAPILLVDALLPGLRALLVKKERFATADAQLALAYLNLYSLSKNAEWLRKAVSLADDLLSTSIPGYSGNCWGYPFDWQNSGALWKKNTPFITATPYCFEAYLALLDATGDHRYSAIARSIARFVADDLRETPAGPGAAAGSYSPVDGTKVVNASAYRAMVLIEASVRFGEERYRRKALENVAFILGSQRSDGSWLYEIDHRKGAFIDHFHTCFVLKNLFKVNAHLKSGEIAAAIRSGYSYYRKNLFDAGGIPRSFAINPRTQIVRLDMYNFAEAISLGVLLRDVEGDALDMATGLADVLCRTCQYPDGHFVTRVFAGGLRHSMPFIRWPQAQLFLALTALAKATGAAHVA
jgi:hypothetical protein